VKLLRRVEYLEAAQRRKSTDNPVIGEATEAFLRKFRGEDIDENNIRIIPRIGRLNDEGVSKEVIHFIESIRK